MPTDESRAALVGARKGTGSRMTRPLSSQRTAQGRSEAADSVLQPWPQPVAPPRCTSGSQASGECSGLPQPAS